MADTQVFPLGLFRNEVAAALMCVGDRRSMAGNHRVNSNLLHRPAQWKIMNDIRQQGIGETDGEYFCRNAHGS